MFFNSSRITVVPRATFVYICELGGYPFFLKSQFSSVSLLITKTKRLSKKSDFSSCNGDHVIKNFHEIEFLKLVLFSSLIRSFSLLLEQAMHIY